MKATTGLLALGLFTLAGAVTVSCGGSSDDGDTNNTAGSSAAGKGTGGSSTAGSSSSAGTTSTAGSGNTSGSGNGGTNTGGGNGQGGTFNPGAGGQPTLEECGDGVIDGMPCERMQGEANACQVDATTYCTCQGRNDSMWVCQDLGDLGMGGAGGIFGDLTCPADPMTGDDCTGIGACPGAATCICGAGTVYCQGQQ